MTLLSYQNPSAETPLTARADRLLQAGHRLAILGTLTLAGLIYAFHREKPVAALGWITIGTAAAAVVICAALLVHLYRSVHPLRQIIGLLLFTWIIGHAAGYLLLTRVDLIAKIQAVVHAIVSIFWPQSLS